MFRINHKFNIVLKENTTLKHFKYIHIKIYICDVLSKSGVHLLFGAVFSLFSWEVQQSQT